MQIKFRVKNDDGVEILVDDTMSQDQLERIAERTVGLTLVVNGVELERFDNFNFSPSEVDALISSINSISVPIGSRLMTLSHFADEDIGTSFANAIQVAIPDAVPFELRYWCDEDEEEDDVEEGAEPFVLLCGNFLGDKDHVITSKGIVDRDTFYKRDEICSLRPWFEDFVGENPFAETVSKMDADLVNFSAAHAFAIRFACSKQIQALRNDVSTPTPR